MFNIQVFGKATRFWKQIYGPRSTYTNKIAYIYEVKKLNL
jgi:hypothetical protein